MTSPLLYSEFVSPEFRTRKIHRRLGNHFTFLICTDRDDLDGQIYKTYAGCGLTITTVARAAQGRASI